MLIACPASLILQYLSIRTMQTENSQIKRPFSYVAFPNPLVIPCFLGQLCPSFSIFQIQTNMDIRFRKFRQHCLLELISHTQTHTSRTFAEFSWRCWYSALRNCTPPCNSHKPVLCILNIMWFHSCTLPSHHHNTANRITYVLLCQINQTTVYTDIQK